MEHNTKFDDKRMSLISVIIPVYNESEKIAIDLDTLLQYLTDAKYQFEIIVVNDGSRDQTLTILEDYRRRCKLIRIISYSYNRGKGFAVRQGILHSQGDYVIFLDAGLCVPVENIAKGIGYLEDGYDLAIASRCLPESRIIIRPPFYRRICSYILRFVIQYVFQIGHIKDTQCGFKILRREVAQNIFRKQRIYGFMFDVEMLYLAKRMDYSIKEFPVVWYYDVDTRYRIIGSILQSICELAKIKILSVV